MHTCTPVGTRGFKSRMCPPYPHACRKSIFKKLIRLSVRPSLCLSVTKTLTLPIVSEVLMIEHGYLVCMILVTSPYYWYHTVTLTFDLSQGQICCWAGDHSFSNLLVFLAFSVYLFLLWITEEVSIPEVCVTSLLLIFDLE